jgi:hypothetical protein
MTKIKLAGKGKFICDRWDMNAGESFRAYWREYLIDGYLIRLEKAHNFSGYGNKYLSDWTIVENNSCLENWEVAKILSEKYNEYYDYF